MDRYTVDPAWGQWLPTGERFADVACLTIDADNALIVATRKPSSIRRVTSSGEAGTPFGAEVLGPRIHGMTVVDDQVYVVDESCNCVRRWDRSGAQLVVAGTGAAADTGIDWSIGDFVARTATIRRAAGPFNAPTGVARGANGDWYVCDGYGNARVHRFDHEWQLVGSWGAPGSGPGEFVIPHAIIATADGRLLVVDRENSRVQVFDLDGRLHDIWSDLHRPTDIAVGPDGRYYVTEFPVPAGFHCWPRNEPFTTSHPPRISVLDAGGATVDRIDNDDLRSDLEQPGPLLVPHAVAIDSAGTIYVGQVSGSALAHRDESGVDYADWATNDAPPVLFRIVPNRAGAATAWAGGEHHAPPLA